METNRHNTIFYLHWIRESSANVADADLGTRVPAAQLDIALINLLPHQQSGKPWTLIRQKQIDEWVASPDFEHQLPHWAWRKLVHFFGRQPVAESVQIMRDMADRIRSAAEDAKLTECDLYLPYGERRIWNNRWEAFPHFEFRPVRLPGLRPALIGQLADEAPVDPFSIRSMALVAGSTALLKVRVKCPIFAQFDHAGLVNPWSAGIVERYQLEMSPDAPPITRIRFVEKESSLPQAWHSAPRERQIKYYAAFSRMSLGVQTSLRRWVLATFASQSPIAFANFDHGADVLVYAATKPYTEKKASDFSYDVLNPELMRVAFSRATRRLEPLLELAAETLKPMGQDAAARQYVKYDIRLNAQRLIQRAIRRPRVRTMLVAESTIIYAMIRFANRVKLLAGPKEINDLVDQMVKDFDERLRKIFFFLEDEDVEKLGRLIFLEALNALRFEVTGQQSFEIQAMTADGTEYRHRNPFSEQIGVFG